MTSSAHASPTHRVAEGGRELAWAAADVRAAEEPLLAAGEPLMERASFALANVVLHDLRERVGVSGGARIAVLAGPGNNGGDALFAGAYLARQGHGVTAYLVSSQAHDGGLAALRDAGGRIIEVLGGTDGDVAECAQEIAWSTVVIDGLLGIGASGALRGVAGDLVAAVQAELANPLVERGPDHSRPQHPRPWIVAVDTPSGIGVDDGRLPGPVLSADRTVTFGAAKPGLLLPPACYTAGEVRVVDIGLRFPPAAVPVAVRLSARDVGDSWPVPGPYDHKYTRGVVGVLAGAPMYPGAAVLACSAAVRAGAGMVRYIGPVSVAPAVLAARPEVVIAEGRVQAWVLGPGLPGPGADDGGQYERARVVLARATPRWSRPGSTDGEAGSTDGEAGSTDGEAGSTDVAVPIVVDAGALGLLWPWSRPGSTDGTFRYPAWVVLTPHAGELADLLARLGEQGPNGPVTRTDVEAEPLSWARRAHEATGATVVLKGAATVVAGPGPTAFVQADAPAWAATAGSGDVLAGLLGAMLAARAQEVVAHPERAAEVAAAAALVHGRAAARASFRWMRRRRSRPDGEPGQALMGPGFRRSSTAGGSPIAALDIADALPATIGRLLSRRAESSASHE
jgi:NAD(P)H-hydrate repair Nnr-like enzyme with NAD(P)H-hydrate dehydratase domain/NAD(P)H-hydrate repair Nnr-like enzyme with NAD(P)H-hydrate epimerase domain